MLKAEKNDEVLDKQPTNFFNFKTRNKRNYCLC